MNFGKIPNPSKTRAVCKLLVFFLAKTESHFKAYLKLRTATTQATTHIKR